jgi:hypothetical protein
LGFSYNTLQQHLKQHGREPYLREKETANGLEDLNLAIISNPGTAKQVISALSKTQKMKWFVGEVSTFRI